MKLGTIVVLALCVAAPAAAATLEIPLPELVGQYPPSAGQRFTVVRLPSLPAVVYGASLHVSGVTELGQIFCDEGGLGSYPVEIRASMSDEQGAYWHVDEVLTSTGPYEVSSAFVSSLHEPATWNFLLDGQGTLMLLAALAPVPLGCAVVYEPTVTVEQAVFILEADFPIPAAPTTWGRLKALFR